MNTHSGGALASPNCIFHTSPSAFNGCTRLVTVHIPEGVKFISQKSYEWNNGAFNGCISIQRALVPDALVRGELADPAVVFRRCPVLKNSLTCLSDVPLLRHTFWHPTMHKWCTRPQKICILAVLVAELRSDRQEEETAALPLMVHDLWLLILHFIPRRALGRQ